VVSGTRLTTHSLCEQLLLLGEPNLDELDWVGQPCALWGLFMLISSTGSGQWTGASMRPSWTRDCAAALSTRGVATAGEAFVIATQDVVSQDA
jgi:hypothetical protein